MAKANTLTRLINTLPQHGELQWIGTRPTRRAEMQICESATLDNARGLVGDRYSGSSGNRHITLIQFEHLTAIGSFLNKSSVDPGLLRRNLVVSGLNLIALKGKKFWVGATQLEYTGLCHPCSRMEEIFGDGGYNAIRGHGGITARVIKGGMIFLKDTVVALTDNDPSDDA